MNFGFGVLKVFFFQMGVFLVALYGLYCSWQQFNAGNSYYRVKNKLDTWQQSPALANESAAQSMLNAIDSAIEKFPDNALYYQLRAQTLEWLVYALATEENNERVDLLSEAYDNYKTSLELRPTWAGSWVGLATTKWKLDELDEHFYYYLQQAEKFGAQDSLTHIFFTKFGLNMYVQRSIHFVKIQALLKKHIHFGLLNPLSREEVLKSIATYDAKKTVCIWLKKYPNKGSRRTLGCAVSS